MRFEVQTTAEPAAVFDGLADFANLENWDPFVRRSWSEGGAPLAEGSVYRLEAPGGLMLTYRVVDVDRPKFVVYQGGTERVRSTDTIEVARTATGSLVTVTSQLRFLGWMKLMGPLIISLVWLGGRFISLPAMRRQLNSLG